jgi:hypothetical protein
MTRAERRLLEHRTAPLLSPAAFRRRMVRAVLACAAIVGFALAIGAVGYHVTEHADWLDATLDAAMILTGMGPVERLHTDAGKVFAICYALFSGVVFLSTAGLLIAPIAHRLLHAFHLVDED